MSSPVETSLTAHCARSISPSNDEVRDFSTPLEMTHGGERAILLSCRAQVETSLTAPPCSFHQPFERRSKRFLDSARNDIGGERAILLSCRAQSRHLSLPTVLVQLALRTTK